MPTILWLNAIVGIAASTSDKEVRFCTRLPCLRWPHLPSGTPFNPIEVLTDVVFQVLYCRLHLKLSSRDVAERFWWRGFHFTHETVRDGGDRFPAELAEQIRIKRQQTFGRIGCVDETYVKIQGQWCYPDCGIDENGNRLDARLSEHGDMEVAQAFFEPVADWMAELPKRVVTDGHSHYPRAISEVLGASISADR